MSSSSTLFSAVPLGSCAVVVVIASLLLKVALDGADDGDDDDRVKCGDDSVTVSAALHSTGLCASSQN